MYAIVLLLKPKQYQFIHHALAPTHHTHIHTIYTNRVSESVFFYLCLYLCLYVLLLLISPSPYRSR